MMQVFVFFESAKRAMRVYNALNVKLDDNTAGLDIRLFPNKRLTQSERTMLSSVSAQIASSSDLEQAFKAASEQLDINKELIIVRDNIVPLSNWFTTLTNMKSRYRSMQSCFGRWYLAPIEGRGVVSNARLGFKFFDATPRAIADHVVDLCSPSADHARAVTRFPLFFNWFSESMASSLKEALKSCESFDGLEDAIAQLYEDENTQYLYLPDIESIDQALLE
ncbi:hypothetical protein ACFO4O_12765 [Glaciecola siphonariae]|uniref:Uncharacterized protein n=1 Tax=Glaciecola siphonariae TaxID=521012 RepID=A0ABV9LWV9_9ALTE